MKNRWTNFGLWTAIFAFIPILCEGFGVSIIPHNYSDIVQCLLAILVLAGIINNPQTKNKFFLDDIEHK
ncbi:MAG: hypothetical protein ACRDBY_00570 [Cetobacterium sp.]